MAAILFAALAGMQVSSLAKNQRTTIDKETTATLESNKALQKEMVELKARLEKSQQQIANEKKRSTELKKKIESLENQLTTATSPREAGSGEPSGTPGSPSDSSSAGSQSTPVPKSDNTPTTQQTQVTQTIEDSKTSVGAPASTGDQPKTAPTIPSSD